MKGSKIIFFLGLISTLIISCQKEEKEEVSPEEWSDPLLGLWMFSSHQKISIINKDTVENSIQNDGRYFEIKSDSLLIIYWDYPNDYDSSKWHRTTSDSLYIYFDGWLSNHFSKFKIMQSSKSKMIWEETAPNTFGDIYKDIYEVIKQ